MITTRRTSGIIAKIRKASDPHKKTDIWQSLDISREEKEKIVRDMVLLLPAGYYKLHDRKYGTNIVDTMWEHYGWMPSMFVSESMMLGLQALYPKKVYASFTLGLDAIEIRAGEKRTPAVKYLVGAGPKAKDKSVSTTGLGRVL